MLLTYTPVRRGHVLKAPSEVDISDLTKQIIDVAHVLSLSAPSKEKDRVKYHTLVTRFRIFCDEVVALLETFSGLSISLTNLTNTESKPHNVFSLGIPSRYTSDMIDCAKKLRGEIEAVLAPILDADREYKQLADLFKRSKHIAPCISKLVPDIDKDEDVFKRLHAFWSAVRDDISEMINGCRGSISDILNPTKGEGPKLWVAYGDNLSIAVLQLELAVDATGVNSNDLKSRKGDKSLSTYVEKWKVIWTKVRKGLGGGSQVGGVIIDSRG